MSYILNSSMQKHKLKDLKNYQMLVFTSKITFKNSTYWQKIFA